MARGIAFLIMLTSVLPSDGSAQSVPVPGDRIRISDVDATVLTGTLTMLSAEAIQLSVDSGLVAVTIPIPRAQIATLERQEGTRRMSNVIFLSSVVGVLVGGVIARASLEDDDPERCDGFLDFGFECLAPAVDATGDVLADVGRVGLGIVAGGVVGALVGSAFRMENWVIVPLVEVEPAVQGTSSSAVTFGVRLVRVGRPW